VALAEIELARVRKAMDALMQHRRPPPHIRAKLDLGFRVTGQSVEIFETRPVWRGPPDEKHESPVAKATYVSARGVCVTGIRGCAYLLLRLSARLTCRRAYSPPDLLRYYR
jgi:hypothetical protein